MSIKNTTEKYGKIAIFLHWIMAILILTMLFVGFTMTAMPDGDDKWQIYAMHKASGLLVLGLALFRWYWMINNDNLKPIPTLSKTEIGFSHAIKWLLMLLMLIMPVAGIITSIASSNDISFFGLFTIDGFAEKNKGLSELFNEVHEIGAIIIATIIGLHILGALKHHFISKDDTLKRILGRN